MSVVLAVAALLLGIRYFSGGDKRVGTSHLLLITLDTTRADHIGCYGYASALTPATDRLAAGGVAFDQAFSNVPMTLPSHATIMTGLLPPEHGLRVNGLQRLDVGLPTLAEVLREHGFQTGAFVASFTLDSRNGLDRGFGTYQDDMSAACVRDENEPLSVYRPGDVVTDAALAWLSDRDKSRPFFCWVHLFDPHLPYFEHAALRGTRYAGKKTYDAEIAFMDRQVARLMDFLEREGLTEQTLIVAMGDHGEGLGEHAEPDHGYMLYETTLRVPLILSQPGRIPQGSRVGAMVSLVDLFPTILDVLEVGEGDERSGRSLAAALLGHEIDSVSCYGETILPFSLYNWSPLWSLTTPHWKYISGSRRRLFDRQADPNELNNLADTHAETVDELAAQLESIRGDMLVHAAQDVEMTEDAMRRLEAIGYLAGSVSGSEDDKMDDPLLRDIEDMIPVLDSMRRMLELGREGRYDEQIPLLRKMVELSPDSPTLRYRLAGALSKVGEMEEAIEHLYRAVESEPHNPAAHIELGRALSSQGKLAEAVEQFLTALRLQPDSAPTHLDLGEAYFRQGRLSEAARHYAEAVRIQPGDAMAHKGFGLVLGRQGKLSEAIGHFSEALRINPKDEQVFFLRGSLLEAQGRIKEAIADYREAVRLKPGEPMASNGLAWILATHNDPVFRDGAEAVRLAETACKSPGHEDDPGMLDTLAAAYAEAGRFEEAVATARKALDLASDPQHQGFAEGIQARLELYQARRAYRTAR